MGDLKLADFKQFLATKGLQVEFAGGALRCGEYITVCKIGDSNQKATYYWNGCTFGSNFDQSQCLHQTLVGTFLQQQQNANDERYTIMINCLSIHVVLGHV